MNITAVEELHTRSEKSAGSNALLKNRLGKCEVCNAVEARYTCPKCELKTCSLPCVQIHKKELDCNGKRDRTKFIPIRNMSNLDFMSDYYFLEECTRYLEDRKSDAIKRITRYKKTERRLTLPLHLERLHKAAKERGTKLKFLMQNFTRHKNNTTYYDWNKKHIYWRIEWIFSNAGERKYVDERCSEDIPLWKLLQRYLDVAEATLQNVPERNELEFYQSKGAFGIKILLKAERVKHCKKRFYELDATKTLKENLKGKILVEFPTIFLFCNEIDDLDILDSDEEDNVQMEAETFLDSLDKLAEEEKAKAKAKAEEEESEKDDTEKAAMPQKRAKLELDELTNFLFNNGDEFSSDSDEQQEASHQKMVL